MGIGYKSFTDARLIREHGASAHPVLQVARPRKGSEGETVWFTKELESVQEAQIECMTGEIYRYLIGPGQPKIRLENENTVASEGLDFYSIRDIIEDPEKRASFRNFQSKFCDNIKGFMMIAFSSIFFEENDLSANNYGLTIIDGNSRLKSFGTFAKIDHGQSFNSLRIAGKRILALAEIKHFPPILPVPDTDWRTKNDRSRIRVGAGKRKYHLSHSFLDRIVIDFMDGSIDGAYIKKLRFQPSILPFYDGRLLTILKGLDPDTAYVKMEMAKYWAVSQILFTSEDAYLYIATNAVERNERVRGICDRVLEKIRKNRDTLKEEMVQDQDWLRFCAVFDYYIKERITAAWHLMIHKKDGRRYSDRYGGGRTIDPIDRESLREAKRLGDEYQKVLQLTDTYLTELRDTIESYAWMTKRGGGTTITMKGRRRKVPATVALIYDHLLISGRCEVRLIRAVASIADILVKSLARTRRHTRHSTTTEAYKSFRTKIRTLGRGMRECGCSEEAVGLIHPELLKG